MEEILYATNGDGDIQKIVNIYEDVDGEMVLVGSTPIRDGFSYSENITDQDYLDWKDAQEAAKQDLADAAMADMETYLAGVEAIRSSIAAKLDLTEEEANALVLK